MPAWQTFPRPAGDTGIGVHLSSENGGYSDESLREAYSLGIRWAKVLGIIPFDRMVAVVRQGIYPVVRIYKDMNPWNRPLNGAGEVQTVTRAMREGGRPNWQPYIQIGNEPNLAAEWNEDGSPNRLPPDTAPELLAGWWLPIAREVVAAGGIPITTPLAPGGNYNDWRWFVRFCREVKRLGTSKAFLENCIIGIHNYTNNKPLDWGTGSFKKWSLHDFNRAGWTGNEFVPGHEDSQGFMMYQWYHDAMLDICGADCAVISCEGGTYPGNNDIRYRPPIDEGMHARYITSQMALMMGDTVTDLGVVNEPVAGVPAWYLSTAYWTWGEQPGWQAGDIRRLHVTKAAMARMQIHARKNPDIILPPEKPVDPVEPVPVDKLAVEMRQVGSGLVQGNVTPGAEVDVEFFGNHVRVQAGQKPEFGVGGFEVLIHNDAREVVVSVSGCEPLRIQLAGRVPFVTVAPRIQPPEKPITEYVLEAGFKQLAVKYPVRNIKPVGPLEYTGVNGDALQRVSFVYGNKARAGMLVWHRGAGEVRLVSMDDETGHFALS